MRGNDDGVAPWHSDQSIESFTMVGHKPSTSVSLLLVAICMIHRHMAQQQWTLETLTDWQTITNLTVANTLVNYQIKSFTIDHTTSDQLNLVIQQNDAELVKDMVICDNIAYTIDPTKIFIQPLSVLQFNQVGLYAPKVLHQFSETVFNTQKSIAFDWVRQMLFFTHQSNINVLKFCKSSTNSQVIIYSKQDFPITHLSVDSIRGMLLWVENIDIDHYRIMISSEDGSDISILHESNSSQCAAMTLFQEAGLLYWVANNQLWSMPYSPPGKVKLVLQNENLITDSIQVTSQHLYWSSMQRKILRMPLANSVDSKNKIQLISQLGSQHLLIVSFRLTSIIEERKKADLCLPLCQSWRYSTNDAKGAITGELM